VCTIFSFVCFTDKLSWSLPRHCPKILFFFLQHQYPGTQQPGKKPPSSLLETSWSLTSSGNRFTSKVVMSMVLDVSWQPDFSWGLETWLPLYAGLFMCCLGLLTAWVLYSQSMCPKRWEERAVGVSTNIHVSPAMVYWARNQSGHSWVLVAHAYDPSYLGSWDWTTGQGLPGQKVVRLHLNQ
jgi:hypothetical protein